MTELTKLENLISISHEIGGELAYVQGGGGNTSVKLDESRMAIKASGISLKDMSLTDGISIVDYAKVNQYHASPDLSQNEYTKAINNFTLGSTGRPSIETGFHALLSEYVIHSHSVFLNVFLCSHEGKDLILGHFPEALWIDYCTPGRDLTLSIKDSLDMHEGIYEGLIFLENHGMIATSADHQKCWDLHEGCNQKVKSIFNLKDFSLLEDAEFISPINFLFPDQVIYMSPEQLNSRTQAAVETISTVDFLQSSMSQLGLEAKNLSIEDINVLNNMQSEKYRKALSR
jgi:rhamnose utilization protein RhaD (predicted bifunctional aldolase and dehydrogenase)